jgi:hypothetical protein
MEDAGTTCCDWREGEREKESEFVCVREREFSAGVLLHTSSMFEIIPHSASRY